MSEWLDGVLVKTKSGDIALFNSIDAAIESDCEFGLVIQYVKVKFKRDDEETFVELVGDTMTLDMDRA